MNEMNVSSSLLSAFDFMRIDEGGEPDSKFITKSLGEVLKENLETVISIDLNSLTITTLKALAKAKGIEGYTALEKDEIIKRLT